MSGPPPPPPPHGDNPKTTASGGPNLPPGRYDVFIIPEHSAGAGFLYLPSLKPQWNSFIAGVACTLAVVVMGNSLAPALRTWWASFQGIGNMGVFLLMIAIGLGAWSLGRQGNDPFGSQRQNGGGNGGGGSGPNAWRAHGFGSAGAHGPTPNAGPPPPPPQHGPPPPPPPPPQPETPRHERPNASWQSSQPGPEPPRQEAPRPEPPRPEPRQEPRPEPRSEPPQEEARPEPPKPEPPKAEPPKPDPPKAAPPPPEPPKQEPPKPEPPKPQPPKPDTSSAKGAWEKAREETRKREEERKVKEAEQKRREEAARRLRELREKEARERVAREKEARDRKAREEEEEKRRKEKEAQEREREKERLEREIREKVEKELLEKEKEKEAREKMLREAREREAKEREERLKKEEEEKSRKGSTYAYSSVGERTSMWPNGRPPAPATATASQPASPAAPPPRPAPSATSSAKPPPSTTAKSSAGTEEDAHSFRPYDKPKKPPVRKKSVSDFSETSWAPSASTARTSPPPSVRGPYSTNDPQKIVIKAVYGFLNQFSKTPASQLVSGVGSVTDGLILRITSAGLFVDDDVRGVAQREWDVKAWTLKLIEVWCPTSDLASASASASAATPANHPFFKSMPRPRAAERNAPKTYTGDDAVTFLDELGSVCNGACRLGAASKLHSSASARSPATASSLSDHSNGIDKTGEWKARGLHVMRATIRDQEGKRYLFVIGEEESWKIVKGLQTLRGGTQVRALGVSSFSALEAKNTLETLGWT